MTLNKIVNTAASCAIMGTAGYCIGDNICDLMEYTFGSDELTTNAREYVTKCTQIALAGILAFGPLYEKIKY